MILSRLLRIIHTLVFIVFFTTFFISITYAYNNYSGKMKDFYGANSSVGLYPSAAGSRVNNFALLFKWMREYHKWDHLEGCANNNYLWDSTTPSCYGGAWPEHTGFMQECQNKGVNVLICVEQGTPWISGNDDNPYDNGDGSTEVNYRERSEYMGQLTARYGRTAHPTNILESADNLNQMDLIRYYEDFNEQN